MDGGRPLDAAQRKIDTAAGHQVGRGDALRSEVLGEFIGRDEGGSMETGQSERVANGVAVRVRAEHVEAGEGGGIGAERGVLRKQHNDDESHAGDFNLEARVAQNLRRGTDPG